jgi:hypothetical protein
MSSLQDVAQLYVFGVRMELRLCLDMLRKNTLVRIARYSEGVESLYDFLDVCISLLLR